jgi:6-phosphogluconolactonase
LTNEPYELTPAPALPRLPGAVVLREDVEATVGALAADMMLHALNCVRVFGSFHLALSGGSTPLPLYSRLMIDPMFRHFPWAKTHVWMVDERRVPEDDERSNFKMIRETIGAHSGIPEEQLHPIPALAPDADLAYQRELRETLGWREKGHDRLDFVLLGMGSDGHTASLFPRSAALLADLHDGRPMAAGLRGPDEPDLVRINSGPGVTPPDRVTLTLPMINASRFVAVLVTGAGKRPMIERLVAAESAGHSAASIADLPILGVRPIAGELRWYLDADAAGARAADAA